MPDDRILEPSSLGLSWSHALSLRGELPPSPRLAIVGSRVADRGHLAFVAQAVDCARRLGWSLVSGGALGVDGAAHLAALEQRQPQLAVLPCGPDRLYPARNRELLESIGQRRHCGLLFSRPEGAEFTRNAFASRNRLVLALSDALLVVQAQVPSGSRYTGREALRLKLPVAALLGSLGCAELVRKGAKGIAVDHVAVRRIEQWLRACQGDVSPGLDELVWPRELAPLLRRFRNTPELGCDDDAGAWAALLLEAELAGLVIEVRPGRYRLC